jgi:uncharacterized protein with PIN domain
MLSADRCLTALNHEARRESLGKYGPSPHGKYRLAPERSRIRGHFSMPEPELIFCTRCKVELQPDIVEQTIIKPSGPPNADTRYAKYQMCEDCRKILAEFARQQGWFVSES